jgi:thiamine-monophosphate kinase
VRPRKPAHRQTTHTEDAIVARISHALAAGRHGLRLGPGDDAAIIAPRRGTEVVVTCDAFLEGVHFLADAHPADSVGYKALARATSDLAAMGATPRWFLLTLALPAERAGRWLGEFLRGLRRAARSLGLRLAGGDTTKCARMAASVTVIGEIAPGRAVTRAGARPGDLIYVSGRLGRAGLGLALVRAGLGRSRRFRGLVRPHLYPRIRVELGRWLAERRIASAMMDISDGLSTDLARLCRASGVGARLDRERIPRVVIPEAIGRQLAGSNLDALSLALDGGDDYELLFTVPPRHLTALRRAPDAAELAAVGEITSDRRIMVVAPDGPAQPLGRRGWDPFSRAASDGNRAKGRGAGRETD